MTTRIHLLSLSASAHSVSRACLEPVQSVLEKAGHSTAKMDIRDYPPVWVDSSSPENYPSEYSILSEDLKKSDGYILFMPVHCYTVPSTAKIITEILFTPLRKKPIGFVTAASGKNSFLAVRDIMGSLIFDSHALIYPIHVYLNQEDLNDEFLPKDSLITRIEKFSNGFSEFTNLLKDISR
ncbi:NADPH-dependent FMN reductase [Larkinella rosea]|uniref:NADPH-dependent FMN reductase-like domain-containing protein n=1 Tax=Larkinella rosea TaxID=2025312 RepID=A0A3P1BC95_9BACT|nr:NAD(P)H-dependent oxidoreductase [Larkinella rosea]RRA98634.1 hypothetical protein EHT25_26895 [Larkinella rosea]